MKFLERGLHQCPALLYLSLAGKEQPQVAASNSDAHRVAGGCPTSVGRFEQYPRLLKPSLLDKVLAEIVLLGGDANHVAAAMTHLQTALVVGGGSWPVTSRLCGDAEVVKDIADANKIATCLMELKRAIRKIVAVLAEVDKGQMLQHESTSQRRLITGASRPSLGVDSEGEGAAETATAQEGTGRRHVEHGPLGIGVRPRTDLRVVHGQHLARACV